MNSLKRKFIKSLVCILFYALSAPCYTALAQEWLTKGMVYLNPYEFLSHSEREAYFRALHAMEAFYNGTGDYDQYRAAIADYANGGFFRSSEAKAELAQMDKYGKNIFVSYRDEKIYKNSEEARKRNITPQQYEAARFLFEEVNIEETHPLRSSAASSDPVLRNKIQDAQKLLGIDFTNSFSSLDLGSGSSSLFSSRDAKIKYWRMIFDGATRQEAEEYRANMVSEINQRELINENRFISDEIKSLKNEVEKLRKQDSYNY
jgi:hypothetical protein